jgi:hypothetical protein
MNHFLKISFAALGLASVTACSSANGLPIAGNDGAATSSDAGTAISAEAEAEAPIFDDGEASTSATVLDLNDVKTNPSTYQWFDFRPNLLKLILAGAPETEHIAILWYTVTDGGVALHYHSKTESVYVIDGTQTDGKGAYPTGTVYFNPPGSGHQVTDSTGFFVLAYAAPPDFANTNLIGDYTPIRFDTTASDLTAVNPFVETKTGVRTFAPALDGMGGMTALFVEITSAETYDYKGNYLLVRNGSCDIDGVTLGQNMLVVGKTVVPQTHKVAASLNGSCLAMGVSF